MAASGEWEGRGQGHDLVLSACMAASSDWEERGWLARQFVFCVGWVRVMAEDGGNISFSCFSQFISRLDGDDVGCQGQNDIS